MNTKIKIFGIVLIALFFITAIVVFNNYRTTIGVPSTTFTEDGIEYTVFFTPDGNKWVCENNEYTIGGVYKIWFNCNSTDTIYDDEIVDVKFQKKYIDKTTLIYNQLEYALSDKFELERDGNNIRIIDMY